jgi:hypothetical protein
MFKTQASARLVVKNLTWKEYQDRFLVNFDVINNGGSEAIDIGIDLSPQPFAKSSHDDPTLIHPGNTNVGGDSISPADGPRTFTLEIPKDYLTTGNFRWYGFARFTYHDIFGNPKSACEVVNQKKHGGFYFSPCPPQRT